KGMAKGASRASPTRFPPAPRPASPTPRSACSWATEGPNGDEAAAVDRCLARTAWLASQRGPLGGTGADDARAGGRTPHALEADADSHALRGPLALRPSA